MSGFVGCTSCTVSHLPKARVAAESWRRYHPEWPFVVLLIDGQDWPQDEPFEVVLPEELDLPPAELAVQQGIYDAYELSCALRAPLLRLLFDRGASTIVFTDTDTCFYGPVDDLASAAADAGVVLLPTAIRPARVRRYFPLGQVEYRRLMNGLFNPGLLVVGTSGSEFLHWWGARLLRDCLKEPAAGMWADQTWLDWVPAYFGHVIVRDSSVNVAFWNLDERDLREAEGSVAVDGAPLRHFHFAGFDPQQPELYSTYYREMADYYERERGRAMPPPPANRALSDLLRRYARGLLESGSEELRDRPYRYGRSAGDRDLGYRERTIYREAVLAAETRSTDLPPSPFDPARVDEFDRLVDDPTVLRSLSPQAQARLERFRPAGLSFSSFARVSRRLVAAARYALTEDPGRNLDLPGRVASDAVRLEY
jgi:hypothetical protein